MKTFLQKLKKSLSAGRRGFTIFFAVLVASLALSVGLVIYDLLIRQLALSQVASQSQYAIYAADTGAECALYWDLKYTDADSSAFGTSTSDSWPASGANLLCNTQDISTLWGTPVQTSSAATTTFQISLGASAASPCVRVEVGKAGTPSQTTIISHGYNTCTTGTTQRLERTLQVNY